MTLTQSALSQMQMTESVNGREWKRKLLRGSISTKMVSAPQIRGVLKGGRQVSSTILMYITKRGRRTILVAVESNIHR